MNSFFFDSLIDCLIYFWTGGDKMAVVGFVISFCVCVCVWLIYLPATASAIFGGKMSLRPAVFFPLLPLSWLFVYLFIYFDDDDDGGGIFLRIEYADGGSDTSATA